MKLIKEVYKIIWEYYYKALYLATKKQLKKMQKLCEEQYQLLIALQTTIEILKKN